MQDKIDLDTLCINTIRTLAMDAVQAANSGHPGTPMGMASVVYCLWQQFLRFDPQDPVWPNRDRFILSAGHASMLLYSLLHLTRVKAVSKDYEAPGEPSVPLEAIERFRQLDSRCPGHPEYRWTSGVETTTGPLGQGLASSQISGVCGATNSYAVSQVAGRLGQGCPDFYNGCQGPGHARRLGEGAKRRRPGRAVADRRLGGPGAFDQDAAHVRRSGRFLVAAAREQFCLMLRKSDGISVKCRIGNYCCTLKGIFHPRSPQCNWE